MFDADTAALLRSAPAVPNLDPNDLPALLTAAYARLAAARLAQASPSQTTNVRPGWNLERLADTYEIMVSLTQDDEQRRPAAFVSATAQQIIARIEAESPPTGDLAVDRDRLDPSLAATLLFLIAGQYADANEAAQNIRPVPNDQPVEVQNLTLAVRDLARGQLGRILERAPSWRKPESARPLEDAALLALLEALVTGIELLASEMLNVPAIEPFAGRFASSEATFSLVEELSTAQIATGIDGQSATVAYAGPAHLARLLRATGAQLAPASIMRVPPPTGADISKWEAWLRSRSQQTPYVWPNHGKAIEKAFYESGVSAVLVLPTGAGKTTVSSLKIAGNLASGKKVIFLAPTHALVDQLVGDLQEMFSPEIMGSVVSSDYDLLLLSGAQLRDIEVMTPERCLAMLSFAPEAFDDVGLLVFDECHLLSPEQGRSRRAIDAMLCVLAFHRLAPDADMLFLSAMIKNPEELAEWVEKLTERSCIPIDLPWKPSRQARGVVMYDRSELNSAIESASEAQDAENRRLGRVAAGIRTVAEEKLVAQPFALWGLQHNWLGDTLKCITVPILDHPVRLAGKRKFGTIELTPNANEVAANVALAASRAKLKTVVFVNTKADAVGLARRISADDDTILEATELERARFEALEAEFGGLKHAVISKPERAVPHNSSMIRLERDLCEGLFKRPDGATTIVATPTLAQGLNLPAHLAILAGDKRAATKGRENLKAHEILNAAARAGRAGHLANGLVLLVPEPVMSFRERGKIPPEVVRKLQAVLPEDDHCVTIKDPLGMILDRVMAGDINDVDVRYVINRFAVLQDEDQTSPLFDLMKSFAAYRAQKQGTSEQFTAKLAALRDAVTAQAPEEIDAATAALATQSGLSAAVLLGLRSRLMEQAGKLPATIPDWLAWTVTWLDQDQNARDALMGDVEKNVLVCVGKPSGGVMEDGDLPALLPGLQLWLKGAPIKEIEVSLGGEPDGPARSKQMCPRARDLIGAVIPRGLAFTLGLVSHLVEDVAEMVDLSHPDLEVLPYLSAALRKGYDTIGKMDFADNHRSILSRVQMHSAYAADNQA